MSATARRPRPAEPQRRLHERSDDSPIPDRRASSMAMLARRVMAVREAAAQADEEALRGELVSLAEECRRMAAQPVLLGSGVSARQRIAVEREPSGRGAS